MLRTRRTVAIFSIPMQVIGARDGKETKRSKHFAPHKSRRHCTLIRKRDHGRTACAVGRRSARAERTDAEHVERFHAEHGMAATVRILVRVPLGVRIPERR